MKVVEKFISINGEGTHAGQLAVFIRFAGCNLECSYCDTTWANEKNVQYEELSIEEIYNYIKDTGVKNITITGGEPLIQKDIYELLEYLSKDEFLYVEVETNGSIDLKKFKSIKKLNFTMDYKLEFSKMETFMNLKNLKILDKNDTIKFVVASLKELEKVKKMILENNLIKNTVVYISPVFGKINPHEIVEWMKKNKLNEVNLQLQLHKIIWNPEKKGV